MHRCVPVAEVGYQDIPITFTRKAMQCADSTPGPKADRRFPKSANATRGDQVPADYRRHETAGCGLHMGDSVLRPLLRWFRYKISSDERRYNTVVYTKLNTSMN